MLVSLLGVKLLTSLMTPKNYGELSLFLTITSFASIIFFIPLAQGASRFYIIAKNKNAFVDFEKIILRLSRYSSYIISIVLLLATIPFVITYNFKWAFVMLLFIPFSFFSGGARVMGKIQNAARNRIIVAWHSAFDKILKFGIAGLFIILFTDSSVIAFVGFLIASIVIFFSELFFYKKIIRKSLYVKTLVQNPSVKAELNHDILKYSMPFLYWGIFVWLQNSSDKWALEWYSTTQEVGLYSVLNQLGFQTINIGISFLAFLVTPIIYELSGDNSNALKAKKAKRATIMIFLCTFFISFIIFFISLKWHKLIFELLVDPAFHTVSYLLPFMILGGAFFACAQIFTLQLHTKLKTNFLIYPKIGTAIIGVIGNVVGVSCYGLNGVVYATLGTSILFFLWVLILIFWFS